MFGWLNESLRRVERSEAYTLYIVNEKRDPASFQSYSFNIETMDETTEGDSDYLVSSSFIQLFFLDHQPKPITFTFRPDDIVESDEVFLLSLESNSEIPLPKGPNVFFRKKIRLTIVDGNGMNRSIDYLSIFFWMQMKSLSKIRR